MSPTLGFCFCSWALTVLSLLLSIIHLSTFHPFIHHLSIHQPTSTLWHLKWKLYKMNVFSSGYMISPCLSRLRMTMWIVFFCLHRSDTKAITQGQDAHDTHSAKLRIWECLQLCAYVSIFIFMSKLTTCCLLHYSFIELIHLLFISTKVWVGFFNSLGKFQSH